MELDLHLPRPMSPESDTETTDNAPPPQLLHTHHLSNALSLSILKPCHPQNAAVSYKECLKNHAAKLGGLALDGCGEFMPSPAAGSSPLNCAACGCHRSFHRRHRSFHRRHHLPQPPLLLWDKYNSSSGPNSPAGTTTTTTTSSPTPYYAAFPPVSEPKRSRTKFTQEQKARMMAFAERLGWRMVRGPTEDKLVDEFCGEVGVRRNVFKVWMHNNKHRKDVTGGKVGGKEEQLGSGGPQVVERKVFGSVSSPPSS